MDERQIYSNFLKTNGKNFKKNLKVNQSESSFLNLQENNHDTQHPEYLFGNSKQFINTSNKCDNILGSQLESKIFQNKTQSVLFNQSSMKNLLDNSGVNSTDPNVIDSKDDF